MTNEEIDSYFNEYIDGFMFGDIRSCVAAKANFGVALMLLSYTEHLGALADGNLGVKGKSRESFNVGLSLMSWKQDANYYKNFRINLSHNESSKLVEPYEVFRCGFSHEYFAKGLAMVANDPEGANDPETPGYGWKGPRLFFCTNSFARDLRAGFTRLKELVLAGGAYRTNFEASFSRVMNQIATQP